jgi:STE24 endopeptidase
VTGFGTSQRIVLWDTTLKGMKEDEILFVMGHEMGHYKLAHIWKGIVRYSLLSVGLLFFAWATMTWAVRRFGGRWGFSELHDIASMPLLLAALTVATFIAEPASNSYSRRVEHEADIFALEVTRMNDAGARAYIKLAAQNRSNPEPPFLIKVFQYSHPPLIERIRFALSFKPWEEGKPNQLYRPRYAQRMF